MNGIDQRPEVYERLEGEFRRAAEEQIAKRRGRRRRSWLITGAAVVSIGGVSIAGAAKLIGTSEPVKDTRPLPKRYAPRGTLAVTSTVTERATGARWGLRVYTNKTGKVCVLGGRLRQGNIGVVLHGRFRAFDAGTIGACGRLQDKVGVFFAVQRVDDDLRRSLVIGRVTARFHAVRLTTKEGSRVIPTDRSGGFLAVFAGNDLDERAVAVTPLPHR